MLQANTLPAGNDRAALLRDRPGAAPLLELDGSRWRSPRDFYEALSAQLGSVERDCRSSASLRARPPLP